MNKKLHRVDVVLYVLAEDEFDACWAATNARFDIFECVAEEAKTIAPGWENAIPYNADDNRTCTEILTGKMQQAGHPEDNASKLPFPWATNAGVSSMKDSPEKHPWNLWTGLQAIRNFISRLVDLSEQEMIDAGVSRRLVP